MSKYSVSKEERMQFASLYILNLIINEDLEIGLMLSENDEDLEPILEYLMEKGYIAISSDNEKYKETDKGTNLLVKFMSRYSEYLKIFDIYCAVDLEDGSFAFSQYFDLSDNEWKKYINDDRWEDLRVAISLFKGLNPVEIVFMSFLKEGQFGDRGNGWQFDLLLGTIWDEIIDICNNAISMADLTYTDEDGDTIEGTSVLEDVISQGAEINLELHKREDELEKDDEFDDDDDEYETEVTIVEYEVYESYYDPFYISPLWAVVLFI